MLTTTDMLFKKNWELKKKKKWTDKTSKKPYISIVWQKNGTGDTYSRNQ